jgi:26S proteasome regulatory subunit N2
MPNIDYLSNAPPSIFAYPPALVDKKEEKKEKIETVALSTTAKQKKRDLEKKQEEPTPMETVLYLSTQKQFPIFLIS